jgi:hypothetical protein
LGFISWLYALRYLSLDAGNPLNSGIGINKMKIFGISIWTIFIVLACLMIGKKYPQYVAKIPLVGSL